jgi:methyl-accepting chemotaxis protein
MSKFVGFKSVVGRITIAFAIILPIFVCALGTSTYDAVTSYRDANMIDRQNASANNLIAGVYEILMERLATNNALLAEQPAGGDVLKEIDVRRRVAVKKIGAAFEDLSAQDFPAKAALLGELKGAIDKASGYRAKADAAVKQGKAARDPDTVKNLFVSLSELSATSQKVWAAVLSNTSRLDPELGRLSNIRILAWNLRDTAGFERSHIAQSISAKTPIPADKLAAINEIRAQLATMWKLLNISLREKDLAGVMKGVQSAKDGYYAKFQPLADEMRKVSGAGAAYPMSTQQWVDTTTPLLFTLLDIMYGAGEASEAYTASLHSAAVVKLGLSVGLLVLGLVIAGGAIVFAYRTVARPIGDLAAVVGDLTATDKDVSVPHQTRVDEIGKMARSLQSFRQGHLDMETFRLEQQRESEQRAQRGEQLGTLTADFERRIGGIVGTVTSAATQLETAAGTLSRTAESAQQMSGMVASASEEASSNVQSVATATEEMTSSVNEIARQVQESSRIATEAVSQAQKTDARINALSQAASRIGDVVKLITAIAEQTNLLALNATIEAARAGEAGRGFAVVASEVKQLASQTAKATDEIGTQIAGMQAATAESVHAIKEIGGTIGRISEIASTIAAAVEEQSATTQEIARNVHGASKGTAQVASNISDVSKAANETGAASSQVLSSAKSLSREGHVLKGEVEAFLRSVRAA